MIDEHLEAWDRDYTTRGQLFGGSPGNLPDLPQGSLVLELGCGNGKSLCAMGIKGWDVTAVDYSLQAIRMCEERCSISRTPRFVQSDVCYLPFRDCTFDVTFATHIAGHLLGRERTNLAAEITRVIKPGGNLYFRDFGTGDFRCGKGDCIEDQTFRRGFGSVTHYFAIDEVSELFPGFRQVSVSSDRWTMRIRGREYPRVEIVGVFEKT